MTLACLVINLDRSPERLQSARDRLSASNIPFQRVPAIDGRLFDAQSAPPVDERAVFRNMGRSMLPGEIAACMSHALALRTFLESDFKHCLILEDDALPRPAAWDTIRAAIDHLDRHHAGAWSVLHCGEVRRRICTRARGCTKHISGQRLLQAHYFPMGAFALCWTRSGAERFLSLHRQITAPFDNQVQNWLCRQGGGFALSPGVFSVTDAASDIDGSAAWSKPVRGKSGRRPVRTLAKQRRLWTNRAFAVLRWLRAWG
ncbi:MAG: glycosyltransferase family 25 protein [Phycisphaerae bacterium]|nr:glycosyltransferase family 25 protein [Phycisphaerae bacterium]